MTRLGLFFTRIITSNLAESMHWAFSSEFSKISFTTMVWGSIFYHLPIYIEKWRYLSMMTKMPHGKPPSSLGAHPPLHGEWEHSEWVKFTASYPVAPHSPTCFTEQNKNNILHFLLAQVSTGASEARMPFLTLPLVWFIHSSSDSLSSFHLVGCINIH